MLFIKVRIKLFLILISMLSFLPLESAIHVIGDSHSQEFAAIDGCIIHYLGPRTMHRIGRDGLAILNFRSLGIQENDVVVLAFGEIDVRCHIGKQRDLHLRTLEETVDTLLTNYFTTILNNQSLYNNIKVVTYTVTPPIPEILNPEYESYGPIEDRVSISKMLNKKLLDFSTKAGIDTIDVYLDYADENGILIPELSDGNLHINTFCNEPIRSKLFNILLKH